MNNFENESKEQWLDRISAMYRLEVDTMKKIAQDSLDETTGHLNVLRGINSGSIALAEIAAHSIKGTAVSLGQAALCSAAQKVEEQLKAKQLDGIEEKVKSLESAFDEFKVLVND